MKPATKGAEKFWMLILAVTWPWLATLLEGGTAGDFAGPIILELTAFILIHFPRVWTWILVAILIATARVWAAIVVLLSNDRRRHRKALLPAYRDEAPTKASILQSILADKTSSSSTSENSSSSPASPPVPSHITTFVAQPPSRVVTAHAGHEPSLHHVEEVPTPVEQEEPSTLDEITAAVAEKLEGKPPTRQSTLAPPTRRPTEDAPTNPLSRKPTEPAPAV